MCADTEKCACAVLAVRPGGLTPAGLADGLRHLGRLAARVDACRAEYLAEAERVGAARKQGYRSATEWLAALSGEPGSACRRQVAVAEALQAMPETRAAFCAGEVSESKVRVLAQAQALAPEQFAADEKILVDRVKDGCGAAGAPAGCRLETPDQPRGGGSRSGTPVSAADVASVRGLVGDAAPLRGPGPRIRSHRPPRPGSVDRPGQPEPGRRPHPRPGPGRRSGGHLPPPPRRQQRWEASFSGAGHHPLEHPPDGSRHRRHRTRADRRRNCPPPHL
ncbi:MAG: DUF222 domain-containing protein [Actinobacteria bacterium]|nr:DUF222 domain-containing protein [Actinomycetota bacterium]